MKILNKTISAGLAVMMIISSGVTAFASDSTSKEEVIYVMTDASGSTESVYAVNIYKGGNITDYGEYSSVRLMNTSDSVSYNDDKITLSSSEDKVYLQGDMIETELPWNIEITYKLDGESISAQELAGKSGALEIGFKVTKNKKCISGFYENYALQASFTLDTKLCENITAENATIANVGSKKQISYTILPDRGIDAVITADIHDFEMDSVSINGIKLHMNIDVDTSEASEKIGELTDGIKRLDDGTGKLLDGVGELNSSAAELPDGTKELLNGANSIQSGAKTIFDGTKSLFDGALDLSSGTDKLKSGSGTLSSGTQHLLEGAESLNIGIDKLQDGTEKIQSGLDMLYAQSGTLTNGSDEVMSALNTIQTSLSQVSADTEQIKQLVTSSGQISDGIVKLKEGAQTLESSVGYAQYKEAMNKNGLDIDTIFAGNAQTIEMLTEQINELQITLAQIENVPGYEEQAAQISSQTEQLNQIITLLQGNNYAISGTEQYLTQVSANITELKIGVEELEMQYSHFNAAINQLADSLTGMLVKLSQLSDGINTLTSEYAKLDSGITDYTNGVTQLAAGYSQLTDGVGELSQGSKTLVGGASSVNSGAGELYSGLTSLTSGANTLSDGANLLYNGSKELYSGSQDLAGGASELYDGTVTLKDGIQDLYGGTTELSDGTGELRESTADMDEQINETLDSIIESLQGSDEIVSFVSRKNENVKSVQFVIKTEAIKIPKSETYAEEVEEHLSFWQKLLRLFGLY